MMNPEIVNLSSSDDEMADHHKGDKKKLRIPQPANTEIECSKKVKITVEDKKINNSVKNKTKIVIEIDEETSSQEIDVNASSYNKITSLELDKEGFTLEFSQIIELCLQYEFSDGMVRIIKKNLIPYYKAADKRYLESVGFQSFLEDMVKKLQKEPQFKFSHLKTVCENLKQNVYKKRVNFVTLDDKVSDHRKRRSSQNQEKPRVKQKQPKISEVIDLDVEEPIIDVDAEQDDVVCVDEEKENTCTDVNIKNQSQTNSLLKEDLATSRVQILEKEIEATHKLIKKLEEAEVIDDESFSPYILCDVYKERVVKLYKEYCSLMGEQNFRHRHHEVTLTVAEGHTPGPARKLNEWLNAHTNEYGEPQFPDFINVVKCVTLASEEDGLGLNKKQVLAEARMLFTLCGKALQERRQKREWRDLICKVKDIEHDPADEDPELRARLDANRHLARSKEAEILEHYANIPYRTKKTEVDKKIVVLQSTPTTLDINSSSITNVGVESEMNTDNVITSNFYYPEVPVLYNQTITVISGSNVTEIPIKSEPCLAPRPIDPNIEIVCSDSEDYSTSENEDSDFELDNVLPADGTKIDSNEEETKTNNNDNLEINKEHVDTDVKTEIKTEDEFSNKTLTAEETLKMLLQFDNNEADLNVTTTILDPEMLVTIEIVSSDSESDTDCELLAEDGNPEHTKRESQVKSPLELQRVENSRQTNIGSPKRES